MKIVEICNIFRSDLVNGIEEFIKEMKQMNYDIYIISGGFIELIEPYVDKGFLDIDKKNIFCNKFEYNKNQEIIGLENNPMAEKKGKITIIKKLRPDYDRIIMIGDGYTDLETENFVDLFIGFGGVVERETVRMQSKIYSWDFDWICNFIKMLL